MAAVVVLDIVNTVHLNAILGSESRSLVTEYLNSVKYLCSANGSTFFRTVGDGVIAEFGGPGPALTAAITALKASGGVIADRRDRGLEAVAAICSDPDIRRTVRTGPNGSSFDDITGLGVMKAARLIAVCEPGQIAIDDASFKSLDPSDASHFERRGLWHNPKGKEDIAYRIAVVHERRELNPAVSA